MGEIIAQGEIISPKVGLEIVRIKPFVFIDRSPKEAGNARKSASLINGFELGMTFAYIAIEEYLEIEKS